MPSGNLSADDPLHWQLKINIVAITVSFAILIYDYLLTFEREVHLFWKRPWPRLSWAFALFIANRYITLMVHVANVVETLWIVTPTSGKAVQTPAALQPARNRFRPADRYSHHDDACLRFLREKSACPLLPVDSCFHNYFLWLLGHLVSLNRTSGFTSTRTKMVRDHGLC
ncbi:hypothetical protein PAXRUDRAFT_672657 [Paxillus rubicundulus Ve08.2h10]|uniref:DUF6533 domain-containing protein n=1 Tax=Paxillus rubicundulus Ve08.2h10 TaxID=930991 RepID=A0A0D0E1S1_9AGAM|nr:hypothetical protein PAXRUDRAFT_672657 [Paxillus rubicundulus Ve08.2h10]